MIFLKAHNTQINCFCIVEMLYNPLLRICLFFLLQNCILHPHLTFLYYMFYIVLKLCKHSG